MAGTWHDFDAALARGRPRVLHLSTVHVATDTRIRHRMVQGLADAGVACRLAARASADAADPLLLPLPRRDGSRWRRVWWSWVDGLRAALRARAPVVHIHDPELIPVACLLALLRRRVVYDAHEDYRGDALCRDYVPQRWRRLMAAGFALTEAAADICCATIVTATPGIARRFRRTRTTVVNNYPWRSEFTNSGEVASRPAGDRILYVGTISNQRGMREVLGALVRVNRSRSCRLRLAGAWVDPAQHEAARAHPGWRFVDELGYIDRARLADELRAATVGLLILHPIANFMASQPVKLFEYLAGGVPVIASRFPYIASVVRRFDVGWLVNPLDPRSVADAIEASLTDAAAVSGMGDRGREAVARHFVWEGELRQLLAAYARIAPGAVRRSTSA